MPVLNALYHLELNSKRDNLLAAQLPSDYLMRWLKIDVHVNIVLTLRENRIYTDNNLIYFSPHRIYQTRC